MHDISSGDDEIISFPVPRKYLPVVIRALADAMTPAVNKPSEDPIPESLAIDWRDAALMVKLRAALNKLPIAFTLMEMVAAATINNPAASVSFDDIRKAAGFPDGQRARSSLGAFTKIIKRDFHVDYAHAKWPVTIAYNESGEASYSMKPEIAAAWLNCAK